MPARLVLLVAVALAATSLTCGTATARSSKLAPNTGKPGSPCKSEAFKGPDVGPASDVDTTSLGKAAPAVYEIGGPTNMPDSAEPVHRVMMLVHGGAWATVGRKAMRTEREVATKWRAAGWETVSVSYRACRRSVSDVVRFYDLIRTRVGPWVPICLRGVSAGGHLALMVAAKRPDVACVISLAAPTDLRSVKAQGRIEADSGGAPPALREGAARVRNLAVAAFGRRKLRAQSPVAYAPRIGARLLLATAVNDVVMPQGQATALAQAMTAARPGAFVDVVRLEAGGTAFVHGSASSAATHDFDARSAALVAPFGKAPLDAGPPLKPRPTNPLSGILNGIFGLFGRRP
jgi:acetyl esterase/lipase